MKETNTELGLTRVQPVEVPAAQPSTMQMLQAVIQGGVTNENVGALEKLCELHERMEARNAKSEFAEAMSALQAELPTIVAKSVIPNRGKYERFEDLMDVLQPLCAKYGFSISFTQSTADNRLCETCKVSRKGHFEEHPFTVRVGGRSDSDTQADCKASTTARRNALIRAFNIVIRRDCLLDDSDPRNEGQHITPEQAASLEHRVKMVNGDVAAFLKLAGAKSFAEIMSGKLAMLDGQLAKKERAGK